MKRFKTHEEAVLAFQNNQGEAWDPFMSKHSQISSSLNTKMEFSAAYHASLIQWFDAASDLTTPWPKEHIKSILNKKNGPYPEIFGWCKEENLFFLESALGLGLDPLLFVTSAYSTLLGFAAYTGNTDAVVLLLQYCTAPESRLLLTEKHVRKDDPMLHSTLLHRLSMRYSSSSSTEILKIVDAILDHDPDAILAKTHGGQTVHKKARSDIKSGLEQRYNERLSLLQSQRIEQELEGKDFASPNRRKI